jgi:hypothetical protein
MFQIVLHFSNFISVEIGKNEECEKMKRLGV